MPERSTLTLSASLLASLGASLCCTLPLVLVVGGLGGAWLGTLRVFEPWRPVFAAAAIIALVFAHRQIFRRAQDCEPGEVCAAPRVQQRRKTLFWTVAVVVVTLLASPYLIPYLV